MSEDKINKIGGSIAGATATWLLFEWLSGGVGGGGAPPSTTVSFTVLVIDNLPPNNPIPGAIVKWGPYSAQADGNGVATFNDLPPGTNVLSASASGYQDASVPNFTPVNNGSYEIVLTKQGQVLYPETFTFISSQESATSASVTYKNNDNIPISATAYVTVKNSRNQTVALGSAPLTLQAFGQGSVDIPLNYALPPGTYTFNFFAWDSTGRPISPNTSVIASV